MSSRLRARGLYYAKAESTCIDNCQNYLLFVCRLVGYLTEKVSKFANQLIYCLIEWFKSIIDWMILDMIGWLTAWLIDWLIVQVEEGDVSGVELIALRPRTTMDVSLLVKVNLVKLGF